MAVTVGLFRDCIAWAHAIQMHGMRTSREFCHAGVAAAHSQTLTFSRAITQHVMDAVDVIVGSPRALPKPLEAMLSLSAPGTSALLC